GIIGVNHDITQLRQAEARLEQVVKSAQCLLWTANVTQDNTGQFNWEYKVVNEEAAQSFLSLRKDEQSFTESWLAAIPQSEQARREETFKRHVDASNNDYHLEYYMTPDNHTVWLN